MSKLEEAVKQTVIETIKKPEQAHPQKALFVCILADYMPKYLAEIIIEHNLFINVEE